MNSIKNHFLSGLVVILPLFITLAIVNFMVEFLTKPFTSFFSFILKMFGSENNFAISYLSSYIILLLLFICTVFVGSLVRAYLAKKIISLGERLIERIPLINKIYKACRDVIHTLFHTSSISFKQVVLVPYPTHSSYSMALLVKESPKVCQEALQSELVSVFLPTTPNPTTGFILMFDREDIVFTDIAVEDALKFIISCGIMVPSSGKKDLDKESEEEIRDTLEQVNRQGNEASPQHSGKSATSSEGSNDSNSAS